MDVGGITGIIQCVLAFVAIAVDIFLTVFAGKFLKDRKEKKDEQGASNAINSSNSMGSAQINYSTNEQYATTVPADKGSIKTAKKVLQKLKKKQKNTYPNVSAIALVIAFKVLYDGNEDLVVQRIKAAKRKGYLTWKGETLQTNTIITIYEKREDALIEYLSSR